MRAMRTLGMLKMMLLTLALLGFVPSFAESAGVRVRFDLDDRRGSPFPSDRFTVADATQITRLRVNLPYPVCAVRLSDCQNLDVINTLDGFNVQPRLSVPFDGAIDVASVTSQTVFLVSLGKHAGRRRPRGEGDRHQPSGVGCGDDHPARGVRRNPGSAHAICAPGDQGCARRGRKGGQGGQGVSELRRRLELSDRPAIRASTPTGRCSADTLSQLDAAGVVPRGQVVVASVFSTQSVTAVLEKDPATRSSSAHRLRPTSRWGRRGRGPCIGSAT